MNSFGLSQSSMTILTDIFSHNQQVEKVVLYGSRAKGNFTNRSDIDLVIIGAELNRHIVGKIISEVNDSNCPHTVDIQILENIKNQDLSEHIARVGQIFYLKSN